MVRAESVSGYPGSPSSQLIAVQVPRGRSCTYAKSIGSSPGHKQPSATTRKTQADASWHVLLHLRPSALRPPAARQNGSSSPSGGKGCQTGWGTQKTCLGSCSSQRVAMLRGPLSWTLSMGHLPCAGRGRMQEWGWGDEGIQAMGSQKLPELFLTPRGM